MVDFTGGVTEVYDLNKNVPDNLFKLMLHSRERESLMGCSVTVSKQSVK
jgi:hypothetical protein